MRNLPPSDPAPVRLPPIVAILLALLTACSGGESAGPGTEAVTVLDSAGIQIVESSRPAWTDGQEWHLTEAPLFLLHAADQGQEDGLLDPASVDVDSRGRIIVADGMQAGWDAVFVYDSLGTFLFRAGREGQGPGEFGQLWWASAYRGDSIAAFDMADDKVAVFDPDGRFVREVRTPPVQTPRPEPGTYGFTAGMDAAYGDGYFLAYPFGRLDISGGPGPAWYRHLLLRLGPTGESWDTLGTFEIGLQYWNGNTQEQLWFGPYSMRAVSDSSLFFGTGETFQVARYDAQGRLTRIMRRRFDPRPVTDDMKDRIRARYLELLESSPEVNEQILDRIRQEMEGARFAETLPAYSAMVLDPEGNLWLQEAQPSSPDESPADLGPARWSVFDSAGFWLGEVETPPGFVLKAATDTRALGLVADEYGVKEVYAYGLVKPGG